MSLFTIVNTVSNISWTIPLISRVLVDVLITCIVELFFNSFSRAAILFVSFSVISLVFLAASNLTLVSLLSSLLSTESRTSLVVLLTILSWSKSTLSNEECAFLIISSEYDLLMWEVIKLFIQPIL